MDKDLVGWLGEQLNEDERMARAVRVPHEWHQGPGDDDPEWVGDEMVLMWPPEFHTPYEQDKHWRGLTVDGGPELAAHIAEHDPARVLREIEAKRQLVTLHSEGASELFCSNCEHEPPCPTLRLLALPYADRLGYREAWRP
jgi:hypothetical protein